MQLQDKKTPATAQLPRDAVSVSSLRKVYKGSGRSPEKVALHDIDLTVPRGSLFALLGPNGAGKSTLINILAGLVRKTSGQAAIWGYDIDRDTRMSRASIGVVPQELNIDPFFTPHELLELQAGLYGVPKRERRTNEILESLGLLDKADAYTRTLSGGMRRRLMVAKAMVHAPPILVLDEPTAGVDIELRQQLWSQVRALNAAGTTVLLTTHYLEEAEELCDTIAIINYGRVIACEPKEQLLQRLDNKELQVTVEGDLRVTPPELEAFAPELAASNRLVFRYKASESPVAYILEALSRAGLTVADLRTEEADLEDIFLQLTSGAHATDDSSGRGDVGAVQG
ncbi:ABC transporter ATP-binding protein [Aquibaculum arenosum]|uniref:ABC transporter ATP-binding protein n=1 Tax=Aquibaculum arenosum TaxID=3032591 RepID=UPI002AC36632|nr:ABC transporter ATP-binding protein [Fodinicurvata sp. CAU 1616]